MPKIFLIIPFLLLCFPTVKAQDYLTLHLFHSPYGVNWESPKDLRYSVLKNTFSFKDRKIGHVAVELSCQKRTGQKDFHLLTGMKRVSESVYKKQILLERLGFSVMFGSVPGELEGKEKLLKEIELKSKKKGSPRYNFLKFLISEKTCIRLEKYYKDYVNKKIYGRYGLPNRPLHGEGAGCSAFGLSFLEVAGIKKTEFESGWGLIRKVDYDLLGGKENLKNPENKVNFFSLLFLPEKKNRWINEWESGREVHFYDPDRMFHWVKDHIEKGLRELPLKGKILTHHHALGIEFDFQNVPTPEGSPFLKF